MPGNAGWKPGHLLRKQKQSEAIDIFDCIIIAPATSPALVTLIAIISSSPSI